MLRRGLLFKTRYVDHLRWRPNPRGILGRFDYFAITSTISTLSFTGVWSRYHVSCGLFGLSNRYTSFVKLMSSSVVELTR